jgi:hypothetical protein
MVVKTQSKGPGVTGLHVGSANVQRYFSRDIAFVELDLGHLRIQCDLAPEFWGGSPEIYDPRLCAWLESKNLHPRCGSAVTLSLIPSGKNAFRLTTAPHASAARVRVAATPAA